MLTSQPSGDKFADKPIPDFRTSCCLDVGPGLRQNLSMMRKWVRAAVVMILASWYLPLAASAQQLVFVVRHAERADAGAAQMQVPADPPLSTAGEARAAKLAAMLADAGIRAIYVTEFRRTQDTAKPLATKLGLETRPYSAKGTDELIRELRSEHAQDIVLVVGHSNTVPAIIKALGGPEVTIADSEYDNLFVIVPGIRAMTRIRFAP
jgi:phosphohistidine phosphatase SixA